jgi:hypothetical protein
MGNAYMFESKNLRERDFLEDLKVDVRALLKYIIV